MRVLLPIILAGFLVPYLPANAAEHGDLLVGPTSLEFVVPDGGSQPPPQSIFVTSNGTGLNFEAHALSQWLFVSQTWGATPAALTVIVDATGLPKGIYHDYVFLTTGLSKTSIASITLRVGGTETAATVPAFDTPPTGKTLRAFPNGFTFVAATGSDAPVPQALFVPRTPTEDGVVATASADWLAVSAAKSVGSPQFQEMLLSVNPAGLAPGQYSGSVALRSNVSNKERMVPVTFDVGEDAHLLAEPSVVMFKTRLGGTTPAVQTVNIRSTSKTLKYTASTTSGSWLAVGPQTGSTDGLNTITIAVNPASLSIGTHTESITLTAPGASEPLTIPVTLTATPDAAGISIGGQNNIAVPLSGALGGPVQTMSFQLTSSISSESFVVQPGNANWLTITPLSGVVPATLVLNADPNIAGLGTHTAQPFVVGGAGTDQVGFFVTFTVSAGTASTITANPSSATFNYTVGGSVPAAQTVQLTSPTTNTFTAQTDASYVNVIPTTGSSGTSPTTLTISAIPNGLSPGKHLANVFVSGGLSSGSNILTIPVTINVTSNTPTCSTSLARVSFVSFAGLGPPPAQTVQLTCSVTTTFSAAAGQSFDTVNPGSGTVTAGSQGTALSINVTPPSSGVATYIDTITITPAGAPALAVTVSYSVVSATAITPTPPMLSFTQVAGGPAPPAQTVMLTSGTPTAFTVSSDVSFLTASPGSGTTPATLTLRVNASSLMAGAYQGNITVNGPAGAVTITAIVTVTPSSTTGAIIATPSALAFTTVAGGKVRSKQTVKLSSTPATTFTAVSNQPWLQVNPASGTTGTNNLTVTVEAIGMGAGSYMGMITITPTGTGVSGVLSIPVTLTIIGPHHRRHPIP
jgi:hypothetical protein